MRAVSLAVAVVGCIVALVPSSARADIAWTIPTSPFPPNTYTLGTWTYGGEFTTDELGNILSFDFMTTAGASGPTVTYHSGEPGTSGYALGPTGFFLEANGGINELEVDFYYPLILTSSPDPLLDIGQYGANYAIDYHPTSTATGSEIVPEPASFALLGTSFVGAYAARKLRKK
jgi:hypothetical protein